MFKRSYLWAIFFALLLVGWLASGHFLPQLRANVEPAPPPAAVPARETGPFRVEVRVFKATERREVLGVTGRTEASKTLDVLVRVPGIVEASPKVEGDLVKAGELLCRLDLSDRKARLAQAKAELASAERDFNASEKLAQRKFTSEAKLASERARLDAARATVEQMELNLEWTEVRAPISGTIVNRPAEAGSYLGVGDACARITVLDPILAIGDVGERQIGALKVGDEASFELITGERLKGRIRFISPMADVKTRTFKVEITADNPGNAIRAGITAVIKIALPAMRAHLVPASAISLSDAGVIGVHSVKDDNTVKFVPVEILAQSREGAWVTGLPERITLITNGQHYVLDGQPVDPVMAADRQDGNS